MKVVRIACKLCMVIVMIFILPTSVFASLTKEQAKGVAEFATTFIEKGNERRDDKGYPLLVYALSNNWNTCIEIRRSGYFEQLYHVKNNNYHMKNGKYLDLGPKWCMDCGDFISYVYKTTLGVDMYLEDSEDPWHIRDMYADANKYENSEYFEFVYKNVSISSIDESKLELGDVVIRMGSRENHGLIYVGEEMQTAHASRNAIKYSKNPPILGFEVVQLNRFYKSSTVVSIIRIRDGKIPQDKAVNSEITWPDTAEKEVLLKKEERVLEFQALEVIDMESYEKYVEQGIIDDELREDFEAYCEEKNDIDLNEKDYKTLISLKEQENKQYVQKQVFYLMINELKRFFVAI